MVSSKDTGSRRYSLHTVDRAVALLEELAMASEPLGMSTLARRTGIPKTTVDRLVETLRDAQLLGGEAGGLVLGPRMCRLTRIIQERSAENLGRVLLPLLVELYVQTGDLVILGVLDGAHAVVVQTLAGPGDRTLASRYHRLPAHRCAHGKVLLAHLSGSPEWTGTVEALRRATPETAIDSAALSAELHRVQRQGFAVHHGRAGTAELAMPVLGRAGPVAALARVRTADRPFDRVTIDLQHDTAMAASASLRRPFTASDVP
jgi:DNA-binding IclR family transcriptional regulator